MAETKRTSRRPRKPRPQKPRAQQQSRWLGIAIALLLPAFVIGIILLGQFSMREVENRPRYRFAFADIRCTPPEALQAADFLSEVQYHAEQPDFLNILDEDLPARLSRAFSRHPWVGKVKRVTIDAPKSVTVECDYRHPVLAVRWGNKLRAVDRDGVLLPANAATQALPVYEGTPKPPAGPPGVKWGDINVESAARKAHVKKL